MLEALNFPSSKQISFSMNDCQKFVIPTIEVLYIVAAKVCCPHSVAFYVILKKTILIHVLQLLVKISENSSDTNHDGIMKHLALARNGYQEFLFTDAYLWRHF